MARTLAQRLADFDAKINMQRLRRDACLDALKFEQYDAVELLIDELLDLRFRFVSQHPSLVRLELGETA